MENLLKRLNVLAKEVEDVGLELYSDLHGNLGDDLHFMCKVFSKRQLAQLHSLVLLEGNDDAILIARSMFEGCLYLAYSIKNPEMCRRWRLFGFVDDIQRSRSGGEELPEEIRKMLKRFQPEVDKLFKKKGGGYQNRWYGNINIKDIARNVDRNYLRLYETYYSPMSEYHHWATAAFGKRYKLNNNEILDVNEGECALEVAGALCMALSSVLSTLTLSSKVFKVDSSNSDKLKVLTAKFKKLDGTVTHEIDL